jgi:hypothetical protein
VADDVVVDLARAEHEAADALAVDAGLLEDGPERALGVEVASFRRSRPFGVITISGRADGSSACRRRRWKNCAAVVALTIRTFSCAASWRKRSSRALECSGPLPS